MATTGPLETSRGRRLERSVQRAVARRRIFPYLAAATFVLALCSGFVMTLVDEKDFPNFGVAVWWAIVTLATVGYGDVVPTTPLGRVVGSVVIILGVTFLAFLTATVTSFFVSSDQERGEEAGARRSARPRTRSCVSSCNGSRNASPRSSRSSGARSRGAAPGSRIRTSTSGVSSATTARTRAADRRSGPRPNGASVPQWIGTASRGRSSRTASAARSGSRCPGPTLEPQPATGTRATSTRPKLGEVVEQVGVAREVDAAGASYDKAELARGSQRTAASVVLCMHAAHDEPADPHLLALVECRDVREALPA